jgi:hypothetical protein
LDLKRCQISQKKSKNKKNILIPNVAEKNILILVEEKKI